MSTHILSKDMPVIIDAPGKYRTRNGREVDIFEIKPNGAWANCHGYLILPRRVRTRREWNIWHPSGRFSAVGTPHNRDIVEKIR